MKQDTRHFTVDEAEQLCRLYLDCQLSVQEEAELEYVLMQSGLDSPLISETRALMGISRTVHLTAKRKRLSVTWGWWAAACVAILIGSIALIRNHAASEADSSIAQVGIAGSSERRTLQTVKTEVIQTERHDSVEKALGKEKKPNKVHDKPMVAQHASAGHPARIKERHQAGAATEAAGPVATDSLDYYIDKIESELAQVSDSLYIERMNKVIQADERLQRIVNQYIIQRITEDERPQSVQMSDF